MCNVSHCQSENEIDDGIESCCQVRRPSEASTRPASYHLQPPIYHLATSSTDIFHSPSSFSLVNGPDDRWEVPVVLSTASSSRRIPFLCSFRHTAAAIVSFPARGDRGCAWQVTQLQGCLSNAPIQIIACNNFARCQG